MNKKKSELNIENINEVVSLSSKILHILYVAMIIACVLIVTLLVKEWGILTFILNLLKIWRLKNERDESEILPVLWYADGR